MGLLLALWLAMAQATAPAQVPGLNPAFAPRLTWNDGFGAMALVTDDFEAAAREFFGPNPPAYPRPPFQSRGRPVKMYVVFSGCAVGADGRCNVTATFSTLRPDGRLDGAPSTAPIRTAAPDEPQPELGDTVWWLHVENGAAPGLWRMRAVVTDHVRGRTVEIEGRVMVPARG